MKINEVEKLTGISRHTIRFYEKEKLILPKRITNNYREYDEQDIKRLKLIKYLRDLNISLDDIKLVLEGQLSFNEVLSLKSKELDQQLSELTKTKDLVQHLQEVDMPLTLHMPKTIENDKNLFGYKHYSKHVSIGQALPKKVILRKLFFILLFIVLGCITIHHKVNFVDYPIKFLYMLVVIFIGLILPFINQNVKYMEFRESAIKLVECTTILTNLRYHFYLLFNKQDNLIETIPYEAIQSITFNYKKENYIVSLSVSIDGYVGTLLFKFKHRKDYLARLALNKDELQRITSIIKEKNIPVIDKYQLMDIYLNQDDLRNHITTSLK